MRRYVTAVSKGWVVSLAGTRAPRGVIGESALRKCQKMVSVPTKYWIGLWTGNPVSMGNILDYCEDRKPSKYGNILDIVPLLEQIRSELLLIKVNAVQGCQINSIPPERVFSVLNNSFYDDQDRALADYIELALQLQFNERSRSQGD